MKINQIEITTVEIPVIPFQDGGIAPYRGSQDKIGTTKARSTIFKVSTDQGITGWGEMNPIISHQIMETLLEEYIKPIVIGMDPFNIKEMLNQFSPVYNPQLNTKAFLTGIEVACWDIIGKSLNKPLYQLLGGRVRDKIEIAYALGIMGLEETKDKVIQVKGAGFKTLKTKGGENIVFDVARVKAMRAAGGPDFEIRVDMNQGYDTPQALRYLKQVEQYDLQYIEQPIKVNKLKDLRSLRERTATPIGINEDCYIPNNLLEAIKSDCIDIAIIDFEPLGGISELMRLASIAEEADLPLAHHCGWDMGVKLAAILHATSTMPAFTYPMDSTYQAHGDDVLQERIQIKDGFYLIPDGPGLGVEVDQDKLRFLDINR